ncbi:hypothetical protein BDV27DRAFT_19838 [Aspergillus caelatus]|uniref:Uncharacterized protein n=1 Tax=Aspergillus caelatus TaxID=61420 RepID=A0A5N6ZXE6_9EURO|nr:uncharacterized protein BDV27DRAFT_19838 [Aspergillus caelatus]KAE8362267.1 hypothetical protein BDV27DRAFT_19838 [Aspergillus caelatus]
MSNKESLPRALKRHGGLTIPLKKTISFSFFLSLILSLSLSLFFFFFFFSPVAYSQLTRHSTQSKIWRNGKRW